MTVTANVHCNLAGWSSATYALGARRSNAGNAYQCITGGTSTAPPTGTGSDIVTTGTAHWKFLSAVDYGSVDSSALQAWADDLPATLTQPMVALLWNNAAPAVLATAGTSILTLAGHTTSPTNTITVRAATGEGFKDTFTAVPTTPLVYNRANGVAIEMPASGFGGINYVQIDDTNVVFDGLQFADLNAASGATIIGGAGNLTLQNCIVQGTTQPGGAMMIQIVADGGKFLNCLMVDQDTAAVDSTLAAYGDGNVVVGCTFIALSSDPGKVALNAGGNNNTGTNIVRDSIFVNYPFCYAATTGNGQWAVDHCAHTAPAFAISWCGTDDGGNLFSIVPSAVFRNASSDFHLKAGSVCIDSGVTDATDIPSARDILGTARPQGSAWDMGAHEFITGSVVSRDFIFPGDFKMTKFGAGILTLEAGGPVFSNVPLALSWVGQPVAGGGLATDSSLQLEYLSTMPTVGTGSDPFTDEFTLEFGDPVPDPSAIFLDPAWSVEFASARAVDSPLPAEWSEVVNNTIADTGMPLAWRGPVVQDWMMSVEYLRSRSADSPAIVSALATPFSDTVGAIEEGGGIAAAADAPLPLEHGATLLLSTPLPLEYSTGTALVTAYALPIEWGGERTLAAGTVLPLDYASETTVDKVLSLGWSGVGGSSVDVSGEMEWGTAVRADTETPPETLLSVKADAPLRGAYGATLNYDSAGPTEYGAIVIRDEEVSLVSEKGHGIDTPLPLDPSAEMSVNTAAPVAWRTGITQDAEVQAEWNLSVSYDLSHDTDWSGTLTVQDRFPLSWTQDTKPVDADAPMSIEILATTTSFIYIDVGIELGRLAIGSPVIPDEWEATH